MYLHKETILSFGLGFVVLWFGYNEIMHPEAWVVYVPKFMGGGEMVLNLVRLHGIVLILSGLALVFKFHPRIAASLLALMLLDIIVTLIMSGGLDELAVRDIGLFSMALALAISN